MVVSSPDDQNGTPFTNDGEVAVSPGEKRRLSRRSILWNGHLRLASLKMGQHDFRCQIWNLSLGGARLRIDVPLQSGTEVYLSIEGKIDIPSTVVWTEGNKMGVKFRMNCEGVYALLGDQAQALGLSLTDNAVDER